MQVSIVRSLNLNEELRIDSEYYKPENLSSELLVKKKPHKFLGELCTLIAGPFGSTVTTDKYVTEDQFKYIRGKDIQEIFIDDTDPVYIGKESFSALSQFHIYPLDILVTVVGAKFGKTAIVFPEDCPAIFSCKSTLIRRQKINPFFLAAYLSSKYGYLFIRRGQRGAAQPGINLFDLQGIPIPIFNDSFYKTIESII